MNEHKNDRPCTAMMVHGRLYFDRTMCFFYHLISVLPFSAAEVSVRQCSVTFVGRLYPSGHIHSRFRIPYFLLLSEKFSYSAKNKPVCDTDDLFYRLLFALFYPLPVNAENSVIDEVHKHGLLIFGQCAVFL